MVQVSSPARTRDAIWKITNAERNQGMAQMEQHLAIWCQALNSNLHTPKRKKEKKIEKASLGLEV
jgi:hypothetical protein